MIIPHTVTKLAKFGCIKVIQSILVTINLCKEWPLFDTAQCTTYPFSYSNIFQNGYRSEKEKERERERERPTSLLFLFVFFLSLCFSLTQTFVNSPIMPELMNPPLTTLNWREREREDSPVHLTIALNALV